MRPEPPLRRYADVVRHLVKSMALAGFGGYETIAQTLGRAGWKLSKRTVARILKEKAPAPPLDPDILPTPRAVQAKYPNHIWMSDITEIPSLFGLFCFHLAVVLDVFSRFPLAARVFYSKPTATHVAKRAEGAAEYFGPPKHFISDQDCQFTATALQRWGRRHGIFHRFGAVGKAGSIAIIERLWRTLKQRLLLKHLRPLNKAEVEHRLASVSSTTPTSALVTCRGTELPSSSNRGRALPSSSGRVN